MILEKDINKGHNINDIKNTNKKYDVNHIEKPILIFEEKYCKISCFNC